MDIEEEQVSASYSLQILFWLNSKMIFFIILSLLIGLCIEAASSTTWFLWICLVLFSIAEPARLSLGYAGNLQQRPQHSIMSLCLALFPGFILSVGLLAVFTSLHPAAQVGLAFIAIFSFFQIPLGLVALWRLQRARSIRFKLTVK